MVLNRLELSEFRNYPAAIAEFSSGLNLVVGKNGAGKTNLLEAAGFVCGLGPWRPGGWASVVCRGRESSILRAKTTVKGREVGVDAQLRITGGPRFKVNGVAGGDSGLAAVLFSPEDLDLSKGGPEHRRRLIDEVAVQIRPAAREVFQTFDRALKQRNGALKAAKYNDRARRGLDVWNDQLAEAGKAVVSRRLATIEALRPHYLEQYSGMSGDLAAMGYLPSWGDIEAADGIVSELRRAMSRSLERDIERGVSSVGPQRDDVGMSINGVPARQHGSQGELRSLSLALRLAQRALVADVRGEPPILLLDDVLSELDETRRARVAEVIGEGQAIATATSLDLFPVEPALVITVESGTIEHG